MRLSFAACLVLGACAPVLAEVEPAPTPGVEPVEPIEHSARFVGTWLVEETVPHATYFASSWRLSEDGSLTLVDDFSVGGGLYPGVSSEDEPGILCGFGERWSSLDDRTLRIELDCDDDTARLLDLTFGSDASGNAVGIEPATMRVDGDASGWSPPVWGWHFIQCEGDGTNCAPWRPR